MPLSASISSFRPRSRSFCIDERIVGDMLEAICANAVRQDGVDFRGLQDLEDPVHAVGAPTVELAEGDPPTRAGLNDDPRCLNGALDVRRAGQGGASAQDGVDLFGVPEPILQRYDGRTGRQCAVQLARGRLGVERLDAEENQLSRAQVSGAVRGANRQLEVTVDALNPQASFSERPEVLTAGNESNVLP